MEIANFGGGCFWCIETVFNKLEGVESALSGYMGGHTINPDYKSVCGGDSGHVEIVQVKYDEQKISYLKLLEVFFKIHDPTQLNRQGEDIGTQYRSVIFYTNEDQKNQAQKVIDTLDQSGYYTAPIVTTVEPAQIFYIAEDYHQNYFELNKTKNSYCSIVVAPKVDKFKKLFEDILK
jgi:peptide-methionine (S)-S-oxide reductase